MELNESDATKTEANSPQANDEQQLAATKPETFVKGLRDRMVHVAPGEVLIGNEQTSRVTMVISQPFLIDKYPVTQEDYLNVMGRNPSKFMGPHLPVDSVSWLDAITFCNRLSELSGLESVYNIRGKESTINFAANGYRLPTEAEWEYCCRGGIQADRYGQIDSIAWYNGNSEDRTHEVGIKEANGFGLYDMLGNVWEWCNDWYQRRYPEEKLVDYTGPESGFERVLRGGSWSDLQDCVRSSFRHRKIPLALESTHGMRVVLPSRE
jgi:formylglycine-generating enzyme required for sulfatase activity